jgi:hypothetical protein
MQQHLLCLCSSLQPDRKEMVIGWLPNCMHYPISLDSMLDQDIRPCIVRAWLAQETTAPYISREPPRPLFAHG